MGRPKKYTIKLTEEECKLAKDVIKKKSTSKTILKRCQILLEIDKSPKKTIEQIAHSYAVAKATVSNIILDYIKNGIESIIKFNRNPNSNAKLKADGRTEAKLIQIACGEVPAGHARWTLRLLEEKAKIELETPIGRETIRKVLKKTNLDLI